MNRERRWWVYALVKQKGAIILWYIKSCVLIWMLCIGALHYLTFNSLGEVWRWWIDLEYMLLSTPIFREKKNDDGKNSCLDLCTLAFREDQMVRLQQFLIYWFLPAITLHSFFSSLADNADFWFWRKREYMWTWGEKAGFFMSSQSWPKLQGLWNPVRFGLAAKWKNWLTVQFWFLIRQIWRHRLRSTSRL